MLPERTSRSVAPSCPPAEAGDRREAFLEEGRGNENPRFLRRQQRPRLVQIRVPVGILKQGPPPFDALVEAAIRPQRGDLVQRADLADVVSDRLSQMLHLRRAPFPLVDAQELSGLPRCAGVEALLHEHAVLPRLPRRLAPWPEARCDFVAAISS